MAEAGGRIGRPDRLGARRRRRGGGQRDGGVAVQRQPHAVGDGRAAGAPWCGGVVWLTAPYIAAESIRGLVDGHRVETSLIGIGLTALAMVAMPILGWADHVLGARLGSEATEGAGNQNYLCAAQAAAVLAGLAITAVWAGGWWVDPAIGLAIAGVAVWQGVRSWRGHSRCC